MLAILVDGFRRMRRARQEALKIDVQGNFKFPEEDFASELPNGGARVIDDQQSHDELLDEAVAFKNQLDDLPSLSALDDIDNNRAELIPDDGHNIMVEPSQPPATGSRFAADDFQNTESTETTEATEATEKKERDDNNALINEWDGAKTDSFAAKERSPSQANRKGHFSHNAQPLNLDEHVPLLMDVEELGEEPLPVTDNVSHEALDVAALTAKTSAAFDQKDSDDHIGSNNSADLALDMNDSLADSRLDAQIDVSIDAVSTDAVSTNAVSTDANPAKPETAHTVEQPIDDGRQQAADMLTQAAYAPVKKPGANAEILANRATANLVLITHVVPHDEEGFCGEDILYLVNNCDLRHGEKDIFHRFEQEHGEGRVQFSMANSFNPGTFDPEKLMHERIHGLSLFMSLPGPEKAMDAFEAMSEMASVIARNLGGDVHDETHSIMALQTIEHNRQQVRDYVRKQKLANKY